jgi:hypothetical protein
LCDNRVDCCGARLRVNPYLATTNTSLDHNATDMTLGQGRIDDLGNQAEIAGTAKM